MILSLYGKIRVKENPKSDILHTASILLQVKDKRPFADVLKNFAIFTGKHLCWSLFLMQLLSTLLKRDSNTGVFLVVKFLRTAFL